MKFTIRCEKILLICYNTRSTLRHLSAVRMALYAYIIRILPLKKLRTSKM